MRFSILTPSLNAGAFLERNIHSVAEQDLPGTEHIVCDGGSTDETIDILKRHQRDLAFWVSEKDGGQGAALEKGLARATGDIVGWLNADEFYEPALFAEVSRVFANDASVMLVYGNFRRVTPRGDTICVNRTCSFDYDVCLWNAPLVLNCAAFFRRDRLVACGGFDPSYQFLMDNELYVRYMRGNPKWVHLNRIFANFTMHRASKTSRMQTVLPDEIRRMREREAPGLSKSEMQERSKRAIRRMVWLMARDGILWEKIWFNVFKRRHYPAYFGDVGPRLPVVAPLVDRLLEFLDPVDREQE